MKPEDKNEIKKLMIEVLEDLGIEIPVEKKFDLSEFDRKEKILEFLKITHGDYRNAMYVTKPGNKMDDFHYYDLLFCMNSNGEPVCIPVPLARKLFNLSYLDSNFCRGTMTGSVYEYIFKNYYENKNYYEQMCELPF